ncbi:hypothetical protein [Bradyrhizobium elkanii]|uniref:hypothetical protein n=1 Tax=Bradyrhizobium elkanii TaxID=29448 RepID=UPI003513835D
MTRDQALEKLRAVVEKHSLFIGEKSVEASLDGYVALGMITLDEPAHPQTLWELLRKHGLALDKAQAICNDAMKNGVSTPCDAVSEEALKP